MRTIKNCDFFVNICFFHVLRYNLCEKIKKQRNLWDVKDIMYDRSKCDELYKALTNKGYDEGLCREIAYRQLVTEYTATRMLGYLYSHSEPPRVEDLVDEMVAILSDRDAFVKKHQAGEANAAINRLYNEGL